MTVDFSISHRPVLIKHINKPDIISFDMGGTTAKTCLIQNSQPEVAPFLEVGRVHRFKKGSGFPIYSPVIDLIEIGAGGANPLLDRPPRQANSRLPGLPHLHRSAPWKGQCSNELPDVPGPELTPIQTAVGQLV